MNTIETIEELLSVYDRAPSPLSLKKVQTEITPQYRAWIDASKFVILTTVGPDGTDASPRGDDGPVVRALDSTTLALPDWRGNNRLDSLRNIVSDGRVSLMFLVPGSQNVVRINGTATLTADPELCKTFERGGALPKSVIVMTVGELYFQCAKAIMRAGLWDGNATQVPTAGDFLKEVDRGFDGQTYDIEYPEYAKPRMW